MQMRYKRNDCWYKRVQTRYKRLAPVIFENAVVGGLVVSPASPPTKNPLLLICKWGTNGIVVGTNGYKRGTNVWYNFRKETFWWGGWSFFQPPLRILYCEYANEVQRKWLLVQTGTNEVQTIGTSHFWKRCGGGAGHFSSTPLRIFYCEYAD